MAAYSDTTKLNLTQFSLHSQFQFFFSLWQKLGMLASILFDYICMVPPI